MQPTVRALPLVPPAAMATLAVALVGYGRLRSPDLAAVDHLMATRVAMVLLAAGAGFCLDDPSEPTTAGSPVHRADRRAVRLAVTLLLWATGWIGVAVTVATAGGPFPGAALSVEAVAWLCASLAVAGTRGGVATGVSLLVGAVALAELPDRWQLFTFPTAPDWTDAHVRWLVMAVAGATVLAWSSRDPARRAVSRGWRPPRSTGSRW